MFDENVQNVMYVLIVRINKEKFQADFLRYTYVTPD
jgi:hypothetical protein